MNPNTDNSSSLIVDPSRWDEVSPLIGGYPLRSYEELQKDPYYALPGFYAGERDGRSVVAFQPGWDGQDGEDAVHWGPSRPAVAEVRAVIASLLISSYLVQDRDEPGFFLGEEPGSIVTPWGTIPARVVFAPHPLVDKDRDEPWENLEVLLRCVDKARSITGAAPDAVKAYIGWRLGAVIPPRTDIRIHAWPDGALQIVAFPSVSRSNDNVCFTWGADGSPAGGEREEYEVGAFGLYDVIPVPPSEGALTRAINLYA